MGASFIKSCRLQERAGGVDVGGVATAVPALYGCETEEELKTQIDTQSLTSVKVRVNACGTWRGDRLLEAEQIVDGGIAHGLCRGALRVFL